MEAGGAYKIGWSGHVRARLGAIQVDNAGLVTLIGQIEGTRDDEAAWHATFRKKQIRGEWFALTAEDVAHVLAEDCSVIPEDDWIA